MRRLRLGDFSLPVVIAALVAAAAAWGWKIALVLGVGGWAALFLTGQMRRSAQLRGATIATAGRPLLVYLYSPY